LVDLFRAKLLAVSRCDPLTQGRLFFAFTLVTEKYYLSFPAQDTLSLFLRGDGGFVRISICAAQFHLKFFLTPIQRQRFHSASTFFFVASSIKIYLATAV